MDINVLNVPLVTVRLCLFMLVIYDRMNVYFLEGIYLNNGPGNEGIKR